MIAPGGRKHEGPGLYIQLSARGVDIGGGIYKPATAEIRKIRSAIRRDGDALAKALRELVLRHDLTDFIMRHYEAGKDVNAFLSQALEGGASSA